MCPRVTLLEYLMFMYTARVIHRPWWLREVVKRVVLACSPSFFHTCASELTLTLFHILGSQLRDE